MSIGNVIYCICRHCFMSN